MRKYLLIGFDSEEEAKQRSHEIALERGVSPDSTTKYWFERVQIPSGTWALVVPEDQRHILRPDEQNSQHLKELQFQKTWQIKPAVVYRYMEQRYINAFFEHGRLRLSSFAQFAKHQDEQRHDSKEGANILTGIGSDQTVLAVTRHGHDSYILSASTIDSPELMRAFGCDGYFRIHNSIGFGTAVAEVLPDCRGGLEGFCSYQEQRTIRRNIGSLSLDDLRNEDDPSTLDMGKMFRQVGKIGKVSQV